MINYSEIDFLINQKKNICYLPGEKGICNWEIRVTIISSKSADRVLVHVLIIVNVVRIAAKSVKSIVLCHCQIIPIESFTVTV